MSTNFEIRPARRQTVKPLCGFYGKSGGGKTLSALFYARGLVGPDGKILLIDTENGRGSFFSDIVPGGYKVLELMPPFSPDRYAEAITAGAKEAGTNGCVIVDSMSHEWGGIGGVLDMQESELQRMAGDNYSKREACKMAAWIKPKLAHKHMIDHLLRLDCALICCLRGEEKTHIQKGNDGKTKVITDEFSTPIFDHRFIFEMLINFEMVLKDGKGGYVIPRKVTHPDIAALLPGEREQIGIKHGQSLAAWCSGKPTGKPRAAPEPPKTPDPAPKPAAEPPAAAAPLPDEDPPADPPKEPVYDAVVLKRELWNLMKPISKGDRTWTTAHKWLVENKAIDKDWVVGELDGRTLSGVLAVAKKKILVEELI